MVDGLQDTSPVQLAIFLKLAALAKRTVWVDDIKQAIYGKHEYEHEHQYRHEEGNKKSDEPSGLDKQREKKMEQERKEEGKGSEIGQKMREEQSRKWWKFWE